MSDIDSKPKPSDNCILFIENLIRNKKLKGYEVSNAFSEGILVGLEAGMKMAKGEFDINMIEHSIKDKNEI